MNLESGIAIEQAIMHLQSVKNLGARELATIMHHLFSIENQETHTYKPLDEAIQADAFTKKVRFLFRAHEQQSKALRLGDAFLHRRLCAHLRTLSPQLPSAVRHTLAKLKAADEKGELTMLSRTFVRSLKAAYRRRAPADDILKLLDTANLFTWCAYSLYDLSLDTDNTSVLPYATSCLQIALRFYSEVGVPHALSTDLFHYVNQAGAIELNERQHVYIQDQLLTINKLPSLKLQKRLLAGKSAVHCLGPLWISQLIQSHAHIPYAAAFQLYCAARQCNDDIHDWREDLREAQPTFVIARLLRAANITPGCYTIAELTRALSEAFWNTQLDTLAKTIEKMTTGATQQLEELFVHDALFIKRFIDPIHESATKARQKHQFNKDFLYFYNSLDK